MVTVHAPFKSAVKSPVKPSSPAGPMRSVLPVHDESDRGRTKVLRDELAAVAYTKQYPVERMGLMRGKAVIALVLALGLLPLASCEDANPELAVQNVVYPDKQCTYTVDSTLEIPKGYYDAFCGKNYEITVRVISLMLVRADPTRPRSEPNVVQFERAEVQLTAPSGEAVAPEFSTPVFATIYPGDSSKPGKALVRIEIVPSEYVENVRAYNDNQTLTATIKLFGTTAGGTEVESDEFTFPFVVCDQCLTVKTEGAGCTLSKDQQTWFDKLSTCQNRMGYDTSYCFYCLDEDRVL